MALDFSDDPWIVEQMNREAGFLIQAEKNRLEADEGRSRPKTPHRKRTRTTSRKRTKSSGEYNARNISESDLREDSLVFVGHDLTKYLHALSSKEISLSEFWCVTTASMAERMDADQFSFVSPGVAEDIQHTLESLLGKGKNVLDLCGGGHSYIKSDVLDVSEGAVELNPNVLDFYEHDLGKNPNFSRTIGKKKYDLVTMVNGMAYVDRPVEIFKAAKTVLKPKGLIVVGFDSRCEDKGPATKFWHMMSEYVGKFFGGQGPPKGEFDYALDMRWRRAFVAYSLCMAGFKDIYSRELQPGLMDKYASLSESQQPVSLVIGRK